MIKYIFLLLFFFKDVSAIQIDCKFEEVYADGSIQNGMVLIKDKQIRYEYFNRSLYTIIKNNTGLFLVSHYEKQRSERIFDPVINEIFSIYDDFPNLKSSYLNENFEAKVYFSNEHVFLSRISILSNRVNLSIYFNSCVNKEIKELYFRVNPLHDYSY